MTRPNFALSKIWIALTLLAWPISSSFSGDAEGLLRIFAGFKGQQGLDYNSDGNIDHLDIFAFSLDWKSGFTILTESSPKSGENGVAITREGVQLPCEGSGTTVPGLHQLAAARILAPLVQRTMAHVGLISPHISHRVQSGPAGQNAADSLAAGQTDKR